MNINSIQDLWNIRDDLTATYELLRDLDFNDDLSYDETIPSGFASVAEFKLAMTTGEGWEPIGDPTPNPWIAFKGTLNGNHFAIKNLFINRTEEYYVGFFSIMEGVLGKIAEVRNLKFIDPNLKGAYCVAPISAVSNHCRIEKCATIGGMVEGNDWSIGGLIGESFGGCIATSCFTKNVTINGNDSGGVGGFLGAGQVFCDNCYSLGCNILDTAPGTYPGYYGGFVGYSAADSFLNCYAVNQGNILDGGFAGSEFFDASATNCYHAGPDNLIGTMKTEEELKDISTFDLWDISTIENYTVEIWKIDNGNDYPILGWEEVPITYNTITFDQQEATTPSIPTSIEVVSGDQIGVLPIVPSKTGYSFGGWFTEIDGGGTQITANTVIDDDITVYVYWKINKKNKLKSSGVSNLNKFISSDVRGYRRMIQSNRQSLRNINRF